MPIHFGDDPVRSEVARVLNDLHAGVTRQDWESKHVDLKEEAGRRDTTGRVGPGSARNQAAAQHLAAEAACMANTPGGGALIVGVTDDGILL